MSFWDTVRGQKLADAIIRSLTAAADQAERAQYVMTFAPHQIEEGVRKEIASGARFVSSMEVGGSFLVIFEK